MPIYLNNAAVVKIATIDLSAYCKSITLNQSFDEVEVTAMGATSHVFAKGLENGSVDLVFLNDLVAAKVNATLQNAWGFTVSATFQQYSSATLATNPLYTTTILVNNLTPINGAPGDYSEQTLKFTCNSPIVVTTS
jgi:hypothetical protein